MSNEISIPTDYEVQPLSADQVATAIEPTTCGTCGLTWDDGIVTSMTPAPSARCPFEAFHIDDDPEYPLPDHALVTLLWQGSESAEGDDDPEGYSGDPYDTNVVPDDVKAELQEVWNGFASEALALIEATEDEDPNDHLWRDIDQVAHDWVLSSNGHGTGFWDRYSDGKLSKLGDKLHQLAKDHPCPDVTFHLCDDERGEVWFQG